MTASEPSAPRRRTVPGPGSVDLDLRPWPARSRRAGEIAGLLVALAAACVRAPEVPPGLDPSRADAPEGVAPPLTPPGAARPAEPDATRATPSEDTGHSHHDHATGGAREPTQEAPR